MAQQTEKDYHALGIPKPKCSSRQQNYENSLNGTPLGFRTSLGSMSVFTDGRQAKVRSAQGFSKPTKKQPPRASKPKSKSNLKSNLKKARSKTRSLCHEETDCPKDFKIMYNNLTSHHKHKKSAHNTSRAKTKTTKLTRSGSEYQSSKAK